MGVQDFVTGIMSYPVGPIVELAKKVGGSVVGVAGQGSTNSQIQLPSSLQNLDVTTLVYRGNPYIRISAMSGAAALVLGAYGAHNLPLKEGYEERKSVYETANKYHFYYSLALLGVPMCTWPKTVTSLMTAGMVLFCGTCYYRAFTGNPKFNKLTPLGGLCLCFGWLFMVL